MITGKILDLSHSLETDSAAVMLRKKIFLDLSSDKLIDREVVCHIEPKPLKAQVNLVQSHHNIIVLDEAPVHLS
jgi:hypothetical protein